MSKPRKKKPAPHGTSRTRKLLWVLAALIAIIIATLTLTEPRQLPALIADHVMVRTAYAWRDTTTTKVHNFIYPLATLRDDTNNTQDEVGYKEKDRDALDQLLKSKEDTTP